MSLQIKVCRELLKTTPDISSEHVYVRLYSLFGEIFIRAVDLLDGGRFNLYATEFNGRRTRKLLKIRHKTEEYTLFEGLNYCPCKAFKYRTLLNRQNVCCKHILAGLMLKLTGKLTPELITNQQMSALIRDLFEE